MLKEKWKEFMIVIEPFVYGTFIVPIILIVSVTILVFVLKCFIG